MTASAGRERQGGRLATQILCGSSQQLPLDATKEPFFFLLAALPVPASSQPSQPAVIRTCNLSITSRFFQSPHYKQPSLALAVNHRTCG